MTVDNVIDAVMKDKPFYDTSGLEGSLNLIFFESYIFASALLQQYVQEKGHPLELMIEYVVPEYRAYFLKALVSKVVMIPLCST
jgi:hypothetical protein